MTNATLPKVDFSKESVDLCQTPKELVQSDLFIKALEKVLEPEDKIYLEAIIYQKMANKEPLSGRQQAFLSALAADKELLEKCNDIIKTIEYVSKKKGADMNKQSNLPHFDIKGNADAGKVVSWLQVEQSEKKETQNQYLTPSYIDDLIKENKLAARSIAQLNTVQRLLEAHNANIDQTRLTIKNNLVCIDGYTLPTEVTTQEYKEMKANPKGLTYPSYAKTLLTFTADITGATFTFPATRDRLQKREVDGEVFKKEINSPENKAIIKTLRSIVGFDSVIPMGLDKDRCVICAVVRSDDCHFEWFNQGGNDSLVSAA